MKIIKQPDSWSCYACTAAMATGQTLQDVSDIVGHDGSEKVDWSTHPDKYRSFTYEEINFYLAINGFTLGVIGADINGLDVNFTKNYSSLDINVPLDLPAIVLVKSTLMDNSHHCLYWNGKELFDPCIDHPVELKNYKPAEWWPIIKLEDHGAASKYRDVWLNGKGVKNE